MDISHTNSKILETAVDRFLPLLQPRILLDQLLQKVSKFGLPLRRQKRKDRGRVCIVIDTHPHVTCALAAINLTAYCMCKGAGTASQLIACFAHVMSGQGRLSSKI